MLKQIVKVSERGSVHLLLILLLYCAMYMQVLIGATEYLTKEMLYAVRSLKSNEDMILALAGQFKQLLKLSSWTI